LNCIDCTFSTRGQGPIKMCLALALTIKDVDEPRCTGKYYREQVPKLSREEDLQNAFKELEQKKSTSDEG
jgi:hypothetical protein